MDYANYVGSYDNVKIHLEIYAMKDAIANETELYNSFFFPFQ